MPTPPLWIGGQSTAALRLAVRFGDGWLPGFQTPREFAVSAARPATRAEHLRTAHLGSDDGRRSYSRAERRR